MSKLNLEVVEIRKSSGEGHVRGFADIKIEGSVVVKGFTILEGKNGVFVSMPKKAAKDGRWYEVFTPLTDEIKDEFQNLVLEAYDREVGAKG